MSDSLQPSQDAGSVVCWEAALESAADDEELLRELIDAFLQEVPTVLREVERSIKEQDGPSLRRSAHTIKGSLRIFVSPEASRLARELEMQGERSEFDGAVALLASLRTALDAVIAELRKRLES